MAGGFVGVDLFLASGRLLGSCALSVHCGPGNSGQDTIGFEIEIEIRSPVASLATYKAIALELSLCLLSLAR